jgi:hypothetical protein
MELYLHHSPNTPSWRGVQLRKVQTQLYLYLYVYHVTNNIAELTLFWAYCFSDSMEGIIFKAESITNSV